MPVWYLTFLVIIGSSLWAGVMCGWCTVVLRVGFLVSCTNLGLESLSAVALLANPADMLSLRVALCENRDRICHI
jgi:hypothetical protein